MTVTTEDLRDRVEREQIPPECYSLDGGMPNETWCLAKTASDWEVYYSERGLKTGLKHFNSEHDACEYFYQGLTDMLR